jgi:Uma2 family endonuclease
MYGLEYFLFFGIPNGKTELIDGRSRWVFPFLDRSSAEAHYELWLETLCRWKGVRGTPEVRKSPKLWEANFAGIEFELYLRPVRMTLPIAWEAFEAFHSTSYRRDFWPGQPAGLETGWDSWMDNGDIRMKLWMLLDDLSERYGGQHGGRTDIAISDTAGVCPPAYYYAPDRENIMIEDDYFRTPPNLIAEVLMAASRQLDRGERMELYRRCRVPHLWLLEPEHETVEVYELHVEYELVGTYRPGETFSSPLFPGEQIVVEQLFETQSKRRRSDLDKRAGKEPKPIPEWLLPPETKVGLEYFFLLGHPQRRWEFWNNKARSVLAFG